MHVESVSLWGRASVAESQAGHAVTTSLLPARPEPGSPGDALQQCHPLSLHFYAFFRIKIEDKNTFLSLVKLKDPSKD